MRREVGWRPLHADAQLAMQPATLQQPPQHQGSSKAPWAVRSVTGCDTHQPRVPTRLRRIGRADPAGGRVAPGFSEEAKRLNETYEAKENAGKKQDDHQLRKQQSLLQREVAQSLKLGKCHG
jgi:hypothetical protein